jgi:hypothetical protein
MVKSYYHLNFHNVVKVRFDQSSTIQNKLHNNSLIVYPSQNMMLIFKVVTSYYIVVRTFRSTYYGRTEPLENVGRWTLYHFIMTEHG